ncbi:phage protein Gp37 [Billgrantia gudaonensis]|uniref:Mu-like prophage protein gp37 n=1 Tax=Billgrantia gudaonensis TaxID=376427 RepID=A0A1G9AYR2_9GAMM|nr:phage protein Gp37 [Halomonas gudaonensis]SDK31994.1 Mu-like prophage protein gp37 [Halomonas gudaonensis]
MLAEIEDAIVERCQVVVGEHVKTIADLPGRWNDKTLRAALRQVPGIYVAWGGARGDGNLTQPAANSRYVVYVVTGHASGERERRRGNARQVGAYELLERVVPAVHGLSVKGVGSLALESLDNLYSDLFDKEGVVVYGAAYRLNLVFPPAFDVNDLAPFEKYRATHEIGTDDDPVTESRADLPQEEE